MAYATLALTIGGVAATLDAGTLNLEDKIGARSPLSFAVLDFAGTSHYRQGQPVQVVDQSDGSTVFAGYIAHVKERRNSILGGLTHEIQATDNVYLADKRLAVKTYAATLAGDMVSDLVASYLAAEGVIGQHISRIETTQADWQLTEGGAILDATLDAASNPGALQIAATGTSVVRTETSTADFSAGVLTGVVAGSAGGGDIELPSGANFSSVTTSQSDWAAGSLDATVSASPSPGDLTMAGYRRDWNDNTTSGQTVFGNSSPGQSASSGSYKLSAGGGGATHSRFDNAGTYTNFTAEVDVEVKPAGYAVGMLFRTTNWQNANGTWAYEVLLTATSVAWRKGSNSGTGAVTPTSITSAVVSLTVGQMARLKVVMNGNACSVSVNGSLAINAATDATFAGAGSVGLRYFNNGTGASTATYDNFGIVPTAGSMTGQRTAPTLDISATKSAPATSISWNATVPANTTLLVETNLSLNGGSTFAGFATASNGGAIPGISSTTDLSNARLQVRQTLTTTDATKTVVLSDLTVSLTAGYVISTGNRVWPSLSLTPAGTYSSSSISWTANTPAGTTLTVQTSVDGGSTYQAATNGGAIANLSGSLVGVTLLVKTILATTDGAVSPQVFDITANVGASYAPAQPTFTRATTAYRLNDGVQVTSGNPRYEPGDIAASSALRIEEGVTNLLSANQSSVETDTTGFSAAASALLATGATISRDTAEHFSGAASLKVITTAALAGEGAETTAISASAGQSYTAQARIKGTAGKVVTLAFRDFTNSVVGSVDVTLSGGWDKAFITITTGGSAVTDLRMCVKSKNAEVLTYWIDALQIANQQYQTSWQLAGSGRNSESLAMPAAGVVNPQQGTLQFRAYFDATVRRQIASSFYRMFGVGKVADAFNGLQCYHEPASANWTLVTQDDGGANSGVSVADSFTPDGWHKMAFAWDATSVLFYIDGTLRGTIINPALPTGVQANWFLGADGGGFGILDSLYQDLRVSSRKRTAAELAADAARTDFLPLDADTVYLANLNGGTTAFRASARVSPGVALDPLGMVRQATIGWNGSAGGGTLLVETSVDGGASWQPASNGGAVGGLAYQGSDYIDGFDTDTSAGYTASAGGVFAWDMANSQVVATGGTQATLEQTGVIYTDVVVSVEMDQAEDAGIFARKVGTAYYLLAIRDNSSAQVAGGTKNLQLYRAPSFTDLGGVNVTWPRGSRHRFALSVVGSALSILMDDVVVYTTTDSNLTAGGTVGLRNNSAVAVGRFQSLIAQSKGTLLAGKRLLVRQTLAAPAGGGTTPVLFDLTLSARSAFIEDGPLVTNAIFGYAHVSDCVDKLAEVANYWWNIDHQKRLTFRKRAAYVAPRVVDGTVSVGSVMEDESVEYEVGTGNYRNREYLTGGTDITVLQTESFKGDGTNQAFTLRFPIARVPSSVTVNGSAKTVGIKQLDTGRDFYWSKGDNVLAQDTAGVKLISTDTLQVQYFGLFDTAYVAQDAGAVTSMQAAEGGGSTGFVEEVDQVAGLDNATALGQFAGAKLARYALAGSKLTFKTTVKGFKAGQTVLVYVPWHGLSGVQMLIESVKLQDADGLRFWYTVSAVVGPFDDTWPAFWLALARKGTDGIDSVAVGQSGTLLVPLLYAESHGHSESTSATAIPAIFPAPSLFPSTGLYPA